MIGFASLGAETGLWYAIKRQNQSAADAGAISAAYEIIYDLANATTPTSGNLTPVASQAAAQNSYTGATPVVTYPYSDAIVASGLAVTLQTDKPRRGRRHEWRKCWLCTRITVIASEPHTG